MGKSSLIIVLGMAVIVAFFIIRMNATTDENVSATFDMFKETEARLIANAGVEIYLEKLYADSSLINTTSSTQDLFNGNYFVKLEGTLPNVRVTSTSNYMGVQHVSIADAFLEPISFPNMPSGFYIATSAITNAKLTGDMEVDGRDYLSDGTSLKNGDGKPAVFGIGADSEDDKNLIIDGLSKPENVKGLVDTVTGDVGTSSVGVTNIGMDWSKIYQFIANAADQTFIADIPSGADLGTLANPKITLINADVNSNKLITINKSSGAGILIVNGDVKFAGNFTYKGIILCYKNTNLTFESTGTNQVVGGLIAAGKLVEMNMTGTLNVKYSSSTITTVKSNLKSNGFKILSWYE
jgi:hypothetical protein